MPLAATVAVAIATGLLPSKINTVLPGVPVPLRVGEVSSVTLPLVSEPVKIPTLSSISVTCGNVSFVLLTVNEMLFELLLMLPAGSVAVELNV